MAASRATRVVADRRRRVEPTSSGAALDRRNERATGSGIRHAVTDPAWVIVEPLRPALPKRRVLLMSGDAANTLAVHEGEPARLEPRAGVAFLETPFSAADLATALAARLTAPGAAPPRSPHPPAA